MVNICTIITLHSIFLSIPKPLGSSLGHVDNQFLPNADQVAPDLFQLSVAYGNTMPFGYGPQHIALLNLIYNFFTPRRDVVLIR